MAILKKGEAGLLVVELCRKHGISAATRYTSKSKYAGASVSDLIRMSALQTEIPWIKYMDASWPCRLTR